ncbi:hypothetical protein K503DRAFT_526152 [Rhizopogon vinicolor AM-OR11-026]|uniref:Uncharacterized protein n=1 Tax=Rhizopogon vinicolor AM-OR11-026 TaxID=1314800 RepID=A0A1B7MLF2_9AGAM|nr:hypothetical protein K503DRAFT_526152 [Rhizopogon vinicolor AM-OR11-026]
MDSWWDTNGMVFKKFGMYFEDHACVTTLRDSPDIPDVFAHRITESRDILRGLILNNCSEWMADDSWFKLSFADIRNMISGRWNGERSSPPTLVICDWPQKEVRLAHGIYGVVETCFVRIGGVKYQVHNVAEPEPSIPTSNVDADLLIYYVRADETAARQKFGTFCEAYRGNMVPVIVVVRGLNDTKAAQEWVERYLIQHSNGAGRPFSTFAPAGGARDRHAEQELQELIQQSCLIRSEGKGDGMHKSVVNFLGRWL